MSDWSTWTAALFRGASLGVDEWRVDAELTGIVVTAGCAFGGPGCLRSTVGFEDTMRAAMLRDGAPPVVATAVAAATWRAWKTWADGVTVPGLPWYPAFVAWPAPVAPPTPNVPTPLALCVSGTLDAMSPARLAAAIRVGIPAGATVSMPTSAIDDLARDFHAAFASWISSALVTMAFGAGTAPVAAPLVPLAPVVGTVVGNGRGCLAGAVPFPKTPPPR